jgi:hypothetical protein
MNSASPTKNDMGYLRIQRALPFLSALHRSDTPLLSVDVVPIALLEQ